MRIVKTSRFQFAMAVACVLAAFLTGCSRDPNVRKQKYLESGQRYYEKGQYREAAIQFQNAVQVDPRFTDAHYKLAQTFMKLQQWPNAFQELTTTVQQRPDMYAAHLDMANLLILGRQFNDAKQHLDLVIQKEPNNPEVFVARSNYYAGMDNISAALADMQKALQLDPKRSDSYLNLAMLQIRGQQWDAAEASYKKAVELDPRSGNALLALGNFDQARGRFLRPNRTISTPFKWHPTIPTRDSLLPAYIWARTRHRKRRNCYAKRRKIFPTIRWDTACSEIFISPTTSSKEPPPSMANCIATIRKTWWSKRITSSF
jgi:Tfp pilus assembly protein PilF